MSGTLKNPFGEKNGRLILIDDVPPSENGKKCGCICPLCKGNFQAKKNGKIQIPHFAHMGKPCDETIAFMVSLYKFFRQSIEATGLFRTPPDYANFNGIAEGQRVSKETIENNTSFSPVWLEYADRIQESKLIKVSQCEIAYHREMPEALILTILTEKKSEKKLAVVVVPPETVCKRQRDPFPYREASDREIPTLAIYIDRTVDFYNLHSEQLQKKIEGVDFPTKWIFNKKLDELREKWIEKTWREYQKKYEEMAKEQNIDIQKNKLHMEKKLPVIQTKRWYICRICHVRKPEGELVYWQNDSEDEAICRECSRQRDEESDWS